MSPIEDIIASYASPPVLTMSELQYPESGQGVTDLPDPGNSRERNADVQVPPLSNTQDEEQPQHDQLVHPNDTDITTTIRFPQQRQNSIFGGEPLPTGMERLPRRRETETFSGAAADGRIIEFTRTWEHDQFSDDDLAETRSIRSIASYEPPRASRAASRAASRTSSRASSRSFASFGLPTGNLNRNPTNSTELSAQSPIPPNFRQQQQERQIDQLAADWRELVPDIPPRPPPILTNHRRRPSMIVYLHLFPPIESAMGASIAMLRFWYFSTLLFIPFFYRARVHEIFYVTTLVENEIVSRYLDADGPRHGPWRPRHWDQAKDSWTEFIKSTSKEWRTLNIISVLLLSAIYNVLQLGRSGSRLVQCTALMSLISALTSLMFGCLYVIQFQTMSRPHKAVQWAKDALESSHNIWWNIFILLSLPSVWLVWSIILFIICLMSVIWQASHQTTNTYDGLQIHLSLEVQIIISTFFFIGVIHLCLILVTFARYGDIDETWGQWLESLRSAVVPSPTSQGPMPAVPNV